MAEFKHLGHFSTLAPEDGGTVKVDDDGVGGEASDSTVITEGTDGDEGAGGECREDMGGACRWQKHLKVEKGGMG